MWVKNPKKDLDKRHPLKWQELVVYLGEIPNALSHCAVAKYTGEVVWAVHINDFRKATEEEF